MIDIVEMGYPPIRTLSYDDYSYHVNVPSFEFNIGKTDKMENVDGSLPVISCSFDYYDRLLAEECHGKYITTDGTYYWNHGNLHRLDGPAEEFEDSDRNTWWIDHEEYNKSDFDAKIKSMNALKKDKNHTSDLPVFRVTADEYWEISPESSHGIYITEKATYHWVNGQLHRLDGAAIEYSDGHKEYYLNNKLYLSRSKYEEEVLELENKKGSDSFPTIELSEDKYCDFSPESSHGIYITEDCTYYWIHGEEYDSEEEFNKALKQKGFSNTLNSTELPTIRLTEDEYWDILPENSHGIYITEEKTYYWINGNQFSEGDYNKKINMKKENVSGDTSNPSKDSNKLPVTKLSFNEYCVCPTKYGVYITKDTTYLHGKDGNLINSITTSEDTCLTADEFSKKMIKDPKLSGIFIVTSDNDDNDAGIHYLKNGKSHNFNGPSTIFAENNEKIWQINGKFHRLNGPAIIGDASCEWYVNGKHYTSLSKGCWSQEEEDKITEAVKLKSYKVIRRISGKKFDKLHEKHGHYIVDNDLHHQYYFNNQLHRTNGPAYISGPIEEYYINGQKFLSKEEFLKHPACNIKDKNSKVKKEMVNNSKGKFKISNEDYQKIPIKNRNGIYNVEEDDDNYGFTIYYVNGIIHRLDGPALEHSDGVSGYYIDGVEHDEDDYLKAVDKLKGTKEIKSHNGKPNFYVNGIECSEEQYFKTIHKSSKIVSTKPTFTKMVVNDLDSAAYRVASNQITKATKSAIIKLLTNSSSKEDSSNIGMFLQTEIGDSAVSMLLGLILTYIPSISTNPRAIKLAQEFRINSISTLGNSAIETLVTEVSLIINDSVSNLDKIRVVTDIIDNVEIASDDCEEKKAIAV